MKISILIASRKKGNATSDLDSLLANFARTCFNAANFEVLIKFDDDDVRAVPIAPEGISLRSIATPRGAGYSDLYKAYNDLFAISSSDSELFWVMSDDAQILEPHWDEKLLQIARKNRGKPYVINTTEDLPIGLMPKRQAIGHLDIYPVWSRAWIALAGMGFAFNTDGWTSLLCHEIESACGVSKQKYRHFCDMKINRGEDVDTGDENDPRWNGERIKQIEAMADLYLSQNVQDIIRIKAMALSHFIRMTNG